MALDSLAALDLELLIGADAFWARARLDIAAARRRVLVQAMSFEGDSAGLPAADAIGSSRAADRRVLVDGYTLVNINDRALDSTAARRDAELQAEVAATHVMFRELQGAGVGVNITNPMMPFGLNYPCRNHKKLIVADDVAYVGGINFSEHNFGWPDMMLRVQGAAAAEFLSDDFDRTFHGRSAPARAELGAIRLLSLDGRSNEAGFGEVLRLIAEARREIVVVSPYLTAPFTDALGAARRSGVSVRLLTPGPNNKPIVRDALLSAARRHGFEVSLGPVMSHIKGMLIDGGRLILGSSNFDFASMAAEEELLAIVSDATVIAAFQTQVIAPLSGTSTISANVSKMRGSVAEFALRIAAAVAWSTRRLPRTAVGWPS